MNKFLTHITTKFLERYKTNKQKSFNPSLNHNLNAARAMIKNSKFCILITNNDTQCPSARMVQPIIDFNAFEIWFGTNPSLRKAIEIENNPNVTIAFSDLSEHANLIIYGKASLETDIQKRVDHWLTSWQLFFPNGPKGDDFVSIRVEMLEMELMNFKRNIVPPEPFGLKPVKITRVNGSWKIQ
ncbi:MAG: pyridoxamine 5'-phosphate oxidase family protein [Desulfovibrionales bacterium]|nr:pyridoxamine 5'-phosphate oxidase family protein [Desulfovibrionales bacterium]